MGSCPPCNHLHFCRSKECLFAVSCLAWLCAKSYKGVIDLDLSAFVGEFVCVCRFIVRWGDCLCFKCVCVNAAIPMFHTFASLSPTSV